MNQKTMREILRGIANSAQESSLTAKCVDGDLLFIQTYNKLRRLALENGWIDGDVVIELSLADDSIFGAGEERLNRERMDVIGAAAVIFMASLGE